MTFNSLYYILSLDKGINWSPNAFFSQVAWEMPKERCVSVYVFVGGGLVITLRAYTLAVWRFQPNFDRRLRGGLRLRNHPADAENYNFIKRFSDFTCLVAVCSRCGIIDCLETVKRLSKWSAFFFTYSPILPILGAAICYQKARSSFKKCPF